MLYQPMKAWSALALLCLLAGNSLAATALSGEPWLAAEQAQVLIGRAKSLSHPPGSQPSASVSCTRPAQGEDSPLACGKPDFSCGVFGSACDGKRPAPGPVLAAGDPPPINPGFKTMGPAGSGGRVDGPGKQGNGTFKVLVNDPYVMSMRVQTGYIDGIMTLSRDPKTGKDTMRYQGRRWNDEKRDWNPFEDKLTEITITYDPKEDRGRIRWVDDGEEKSEGYWGGGGDDDKLMTIEFGGGWDHDFHRD
ncbi:MAG: hypothetical protein HY924_11400 [Elusimicrobia bacterium]|nr:hypothetical protein [Elusimicrobiota bacterium]